MIAEGKDDSSEADAIRDLTDVPWAALSEIERERVCNLSEDLYSLVESTVKVQPMISEVRSKLDEVLQLKPQGQWDKALDMLRQSRSDIDPMLVSYLRGMIWQEAGDPATAELFLHHADRLKLENDLKEADLETIAGNGEIKC